MDTSTLIALGALLISMVGLFLNSRKDTRSDAAVNAVTQTKLDNLINGVTDIRVEVRSMHDLINDHTERLARAEARLDMIEGKKGEKHD